MSLKKKFTAKKCTVDFNVNVNAAEGAEKVYLVGEFNSWNETSLPMKKCPDGSFALSKEFEINKAFQFRYLLTYADGGKKWINDWKADSYVRSELANDDNSVLDTTAPKAEKESKKPAPKSAAKTSKTTKKVLKSK